MGNAVYQPHTYLSTDELHAQIIAAVPQAAGELHPRQYTQSSFYYRAPGIPPCGPAPIDSLHSETALEYTDHLLGRRRTMPWPRAPER